MDELLKQLVESFVPTTANNRIDEIEIPDEFPFPHGSVKVPDRLKESQRSVRINERGEEVRTLWISDVIAHIVNAYRMLAHDNFDACLGEMDRALKCIDRLIVEHVRESLKFRHGEGFMAFVQAHEAVPRNSVVVSRNTIDLLAKEAEVWRKASEVSTVRFPNLGPSTTMSCKLIVDSNIRIRGNICDRPQMKVLLELVNQLNKQRKAMDAVYMNPYDLEHNLKGDGDGDLIYLKILSAGKQHRKNVDWMRKPGEISEESVRKMIRKAKRPRDGELSDYLEAYLALSRIGVVTYGIRWELFKKTRAMARKGEELPLSVAWRAMAEEAIEMVETVMDMRKKDPNQEDKIRKVEDFISRVNKEMWRARNLQNDWFCHVVLSNSEFDVSGFNKSFPTIQSFMNYVQAKKQ